jgi:hypothetical protein
LLLSLVGAALAVVGIGITIAIRFTTEMAIPGWATTTVGILVLALLQVLSMALLFTFSVLSNRKGQSIIPLKDYKYYVRSVS